jgi:hypothetical protein
LRGERRLRVFENRVLRRIFGPERDKVTGEWRKLHNEELNDLCSLPSIVRMVSDFTFTFTGFWWGNLRKRENWGDPDVDERVI